MKTLSQDPFVKLLSLPVGKDACSYYRIRKPFELINRKHPGSAHVLDMQRDGGVSLPVIFQAAHVVFTRPGGEAALRQIKHMPDVNMQALTVMDIDDNIEHISPLSDFYREYGLAEAEYDGKPLWRDGESGFDLSANRLRVKSLILGLRDADLVMVTTKELATYAMQYNKNVYINPNSIDFSVWSRVNHREHKRLRVVWGGSPSHYEDWHTIKKPLAKLLREYDFDIYMMGSAYMGIFPKKYHHRIKVLPWVSFDAHSYRMKAIEPDIAVIPLAKNDFNRYKSPIKWLETSALGIPALVSNVTPYKEVINKKTAIPFTTEKDFYNGMVELLTNRGLRKNIGNAAYLQVLYNHNQDLVSQQLYKTLCQMLSSK